MPTAVNLGISRFVEDGHEPNSLLAGLLLSQAHNAPLTPTVLEEVLQGIAGQTDRAYRYASTPDFVPGLPRYKYISPESGQSTTQTIVEQETGGSLTQWHWYWAIKPGHVQFLARQILIDSYGYDLDTNRVVSLEGTYPNESTGVYLTRVQLRLNNTAANFVWPENSSDFAFQEKMQAPFALPTSDYALRVGGDIPDEIRVYVSYQDDVSSNVVTEFITLPFDFSLMAAPHVHAFYTYTISAQNYLGLFTYKIGTGTYPALDDIHASLEAEQPFLPFIHFRGNKQEISDPVNALSQDTWDSYDRICRLLGLNYREIGDEVHKNPGVADIDDAYLYWGVPLNSTHPTDQQYLYKFFSWFKDTVLTQATGMKLLAPYWTGIYFECDTITRTTHTGTIGAVGTITVTIQTNNGTVETEDENGNPVSVPTTDKDIVLQKQVDATTYEELFVQNLTLEYLIAFPATNPTERHNAEGDMLPIELTDARFLVPVHIDLAKEMGLLNREVLYARSMHLMSASAVTYDPQWYEDPGFADILKTMGVILVVVSVATGLIGIAEQIYTLYGLTGATLIFATIAVYAAIHVVLSHGFRYIVKELGTENAGILAAILVVASIVVIAYTGDTSIPQEQLTRTWAERLLWAGNNLVPAISQQNKDEMSALIREHEIFQEWLEEKWEELEEIERSLNPLFPVNALELTRLVPASIPGESPDDFFNRTIHTGNIGTLGFDYIESYVDQALRLPTIADTFRGY